MMGDLPIYVAGDSADVWEHPELFDTTAVSGVPPDYFSATGQLWGNPLYRWDKMKEEGYRWWIERMRAALAMFDLVRIDHFRGFEAYWAVPAGELTAEHGQWIKGPGADLFRALKAALGYLPVVAENLGVITPEVEALRNEFGFPGMAILQFAFGKDDQARSFKPHNYVHNLVAYSGTHDNDTVMGWWQSEGGDSTRSAQDIAEEKAHARAVSCDRWRRDELDSHPRPDGLGRRHGPLPGAGCLRPRQRSAHEHPCGSERKLALANEARRPYARTGQSPPRDVANLRANRIGPRPISRDIRATPTPAPPATSAPSPRGPCVRRPSRI